MLDDIREKKTSLSTYILVGAAGIGMLFLGVPFFVNDSGITVASVNDEDITIQEFNYAMQRAGSQASQRDVLAGLINARLVDEHAAKVGFVFPEQRLYAMLRKQFPNDQDYQAFLNQIGYTAKGYEQTLRTELARESYINMLTDSQFVVPTVSDQLLSNLMAKRSLDIAMLPLDPVLKQVNIDEQESKNYYNEHKEQYKTQPTVKLSYVLFNADSLVKPDDITAAELTKYKAEQAKKSLRDGQYLIFDRAKDAEEAHKLLAQGKTFQDIAAAIDSKKYAGEHGNLDLHANGAGISKAVDEKLFALDKKGDISEVFDTEYGKMIVILNNVQHEAEGKSDAALRTELAKEQAQQRYHELSNQAFDAASADKNINEIASILGSKVQEAAALTPLSKQPVWLQNPQVQEQLFGEHPIAASNTGVPVELSEHSSIFFTVDNREAPTIPAYEKVQAQVTQDAKYAKAEIQLTQEADKFAAQWQQNPAAINTALGKLSGTIKQFDNINQVKELPNIPPAVAKAALEQDQALNIIEDGGNRYVIKLNTINITAPDNLNAADKAQWQLQWQQFQDTALLINLNTWLRNQADININPQYFQ